MRTPKEVGQAYDFISDRYLSSMGDYPDISAAFYNDDYNKGYQQAQKDKHRLVLEGLEFKANDNILDVGCGWGPMLNYIRERDGFGIGLTVSRKQFEYCKDRALNVLLRDWKETSPRILGIRSFDGIISIGALEHFCSINEYLEGKQETIYGDFFKFCYNNVKDNGRLYLQTMIWGDKIPRYPEDVDVKAPKGSDERVTGTISKLFPESWLPLSLEQIINSAKPYFNLISYNNGRQDYILTLTGIHKEWYNNGGLITLKEIGRILIDKDFRKNIKYKLESIKYQHFREAFIRRLIDHYRMFFQKK